MHTRAEFVWIPSGELFGILQIPYVEDSIFKYSEAVELVCPIYHHFNAPSDAVGLSKGWEGAR